MMISGFGFRISAFFRISDFGLRISNFERWTSLLRLGYIALASLIS